MELRVNHTLCHCVRDDGNAHRVGDYHRRATASQSRRCTPVSVAEARIGAESGGHFRYSGNDKASALLQALCPLLLAIAVRSPALRSSLFSPRRQISQEPSFPAISRPRWLICRARRPSVERERERERERGRSAPAIVEPSAGGGVEDADSMRGATDAVAVARDVASSSPSKPASALDLMRYPTPSSDGLPLPNGIGSGGASKKPAAAAPAPATPAPRSSKDDVAPPAVATDSSRLAAFLATTSLDAKPRPRLPQTQAQPQPPAQAAPTSAPTSAAAAAVVSTKSPAGDHGHGHGGNGQHPSSDHSDPASPSSTGGGELLLQWGQNKRMRCRRDSTSVSASPQRGRQAGGGKIQRRSPSPAADKLMPPPSTAPYTRASNLRSASPLPPRSSSSAGASDEHHARRPHPLRSAEDRAGAAGKFSAAAARAEKQRALSPHNKVGPGFVMGLGVPDPRPPPPQQHNQGGSGSGQQAGAAAPKPAPKLEVPRIYTTLSRKEKEEDFLAFKGTKLPQRPKRRPKNVEKTVNSICPGMWLTDVTRSRYEVREKKCPKKQQKNRGLKGMESMDSDSD